MVEISQLAQDHVLRLSEEYSTPYNALIREHIVMGVSRYFLERWVPVLGTAPAALVNTLRQLNYHSPDQPVTISGSILAREAAMSRRHLYTCLETPWLTAFLRITSGKRIRSQTGKVVQEANQYHIRMDDPLSPSDAEHLMLHLPTLASTPLEATEIALQLPARELWASIPNEHTTHFNQPGPLNAKTVLEQAFPNWEARTTEQKQRFAQAAENLHRHITLVRTDGRASKIIVPQYFRTRWWAHLGHDLAWSYLWLRGAVYDNPDTGIARNTCWIPSLDTLLDVIGRPREWWRRNVEQSKARAGGWTPADFFEQLALQKGRDPSQPQRVARQFLVRVEIPIAPSDRITYSRLLIEWPDTVADHNEEINIDPIDTPDAPGQASPHERYISTHRQTQGQTHFDTPANTRSNTFRHTQILNLCHKSTHSSPTSIHRESESLYKAQNKNSPFPSSKHSIADKTKIAAGADKKTTVSKNLKNLETLLARALEETPEQALSQIGEPKIWLEQAWPEPIQPHTPAWNRVVTGEVGMVDLIALMLAVWADNTIKHPPRYLSWLLQQWKAQPDVPPVLNWERWKKLALLPIGRWNSVGRQEWIELAASTHRTLPFGLEQLTQNTDFDLEDESTTKFDTAYVANQPFTVPIEAEPSVAQGNNSKFTSERVLSIDEIWYATLHELSSKLHRSSYKNWVEGTSIVSYEDGVLTLRAQHFMAREQLSRRFNALIEETATGIAKSPITIRYVL